MRLRGKATIDIATPGMLRRPSNNFHRWLNFAFFLPTVIVNSEIEPTAKVIARPAQPTTYRRIDPIFSVQSEVSSRFRGLIVIFHELIPMIC